jgi:hypothetical protein
VLTLQIIALIRSNPPSDIHRRANLAMNDLILAMGGLELFPLCFQICLFPIRLAQGR